MDWKSEHPHYSGYNLHEGEIPSSPWDLWNEWQNQSKKVLQYSNEIALATADKTGSVSVRMVLLKFSSQEKGFIWFTNRTSEKGSQLIENPHAEILWFCREQHRQVRIRGPVTEIARQEVLEYAHSRPRKSQISAFISRQSHEVSSNAQLQKEFSTADIRYQDTELQQLPVSDQWTGFSLQAIRFEFWQGDTERLHDRIIYTHTNHMWTTTRLYP